LENEFAQNDASTLEEKRTSKVESETIDRDKISEITKHTIEGKTI
jgi:hypothetical protein